MAKNTDLYAILRAYSNKIASPYIDIGVFITFLSKYVQHLVPKQPEWTDWVQDTNLKFWDTMGKYTEDGRCILLTDTAAGRIYLPYYAVDKLKAAYQDLEGCADIPFPNEESLKISLPQTQLMILNLETDLAPFLDKPAASYLPVIRLIFPDARWDALILAPMIPRSLLEAAILKVRYYLTQHNNKDYSMHKLVGLLPGKEGGLRENMDMVIARPQDCLSSIKGGGEVTYLFWTSLSSLIKEDLRKKSELFSSDIAVLEAVYVVELCLNLYKSKLQKERVKETALRYLDRALEKAPYYFTQDQIIKFTDNKGTALLGQYSEADLNGHIKKKTSESPEGVVPEWLVVQARHGEQYYLKKDKYLPLVSRLIIEAQGGMRKEILTRWTEILDNFNTEPAMENDADFERFLGSLNASMNPLLHDFLEDKKLFWVYDEMERTEKAIPIASRIFERGKLIPYSLMFLLKRKEILFDAKMSLPFWYSIPILRSIFAFFAKLSKKKKHNRRGTKKAGNIDFAETEASADASRAHQREFLSNVKEMESELVPGDRDINDCLRDLQHQWGRLLDSKAQQNLVDDVNSLIRDNLRQSLRVWKKQRITLTHLRDLAQGLVYGNPNLRALNSRDALLLYMQVYMVKLLKTVKIQ
ncbi:MAG: hypothetical protein LBU19_03485 [Treponema sp.]|jgi:hypothetical protein|nr:hypothetical protein [Treponema sp.]